MTAAAAVPSVAKLPASDGGWNDNIDIAVKNQPSNSCNMPQSPAARAIQLNVVRRDAVLHIATPFKAAMETE
jgi:hypothetical protein